MCVYACVCINTEAHRALCASVTCLLVHLLKYLLEPLSYGLWISSEIDLEGVGKQTLSMIKGFEIIAGIIACFLSHCGASLYLQVLPTLTGKKSPNTRSYMVQINGLSNPNHCKISYSTSCNFSCTISRVGQDHIYTTYIRHFWQGNHHIYGHIRCIYTVLVNPIHVQ